MSEIGKMYKNVGICEDIVYCSECTKECPLFTVKKQIELIKLLSSNSIGFETCIEEFCRKENFEEALAESINHLWQDLAEEERKQVKGILE